MKNIQLKFKHLVLLVFIIQSSWFIYEYRNKDRYFFVKNYGVIDKRNGVTHGLDYDLDHKNKITKQIKRKFVKAE